MTDYLDSSTISTKTAVSAVERGPFTDVGTPVTSTTEVFFEVANTFDSAVITTISGFDPISLDVYEISTRYYDGSAWNTTYTYDGSFPTAGSMGTVGDDGAL